MWQDYIQPVSTIIALTLSTAALIFAQFPIESSGVKWAYIGFVTAFNLLAAGFVSYGQYYTLK